MPCQAPQACPAVGPHLGGDHQAIRVGRERRADQLVGRTQRGEVERRNSDVD